MSEESGETVGVVATSRIEEEIDYPTFEDAYEYYEEEDEWYGINMVGRDQHEEKGAKYDREDGFYTETNDMLGMIDSGAAVTVCGSEWIEKWLPSSTPRKWQLSSKVFRFGDGRKVQSNGWAILRALLSNTKNSHGVVLRLKTDIVPGTLPLLISFSSLRLMKCTVDFENLALVRRNATTPLLMSKSGHVFVHMKPIESGLWNDTQQLQVDKQIFPCHGGDPDTYKDAIALPTVCEVYAETTTAGTGANAQSQEEHRPSQDNNEYNNEDLSLCQIRKLHVHLGHVSAETMVRLFQNAKRHISIKKINQALEPCKCDKTTTSMQRPLVHINGATHCGEHIAVDIFYPVVRTSKKFPFLAAICILSRFVVVTMMDSHKTPRIADALFVSWFQIFGRPKRIATHHSPVFAGSEWEEMLDTFEIQHTMTASYSAHENGMIERSIHLLKVGFDKVRQCLPKIGIARAMTWACMAKNLVPMVRCALSPAKIMIGRNTIMETLEGRPLSNPTGEGKETASMQLQLQTMLEARTAIVKADAGRILRIGLTRPLRAYSNVQYRVNDHVLLRMKTANTKEEKWIGGYRVVGVLSHHLILERGLRLFKFPKFKVRPVHDPDKFTETLDDTRKSVGGNRWPFQPEDKQEEPASSSTDVAEWVTDECYTFSSEIEAEEKMSMLWWTDVHGEFSSGQWISQVPVKGELRIYESIVNLKPKVEHSIIEGKEEAILDGTDLNRITPRLFLLCARARQSIVRELYALLKIHNGKAALQLIDQKDSAFKNNRRIFSMIVLKKKTTNEFKARLVLRGDTIAESETAFSSAPTTGRHSVAMLLLLATFFGWKVSSIDATQAFLQSDDLQQDDKQVAILPPYISIKMPRMLKKCPISGMAVVQEEDIHVRGRSEYKAQSKAELNLGFKIGLITHKPLYGGRDAPLRWYLKICAALRYGGWKHCRTDVCTFAKYIVDQRGKVVKPSSMIIVHVDDLLIASNSSDLKLFEQVMAQFRTAPLCILKQNEAMEYLGLQICRDGKNRLGMHQQPYCEKLMSIKIEDVVKNNTFCISEERWRTLQRQLVGSLIWVTQTRFDACAVATYLSTSSVSCVADAIKAVEFLKIYNRCVKELQSSSLIVWYNPVELNEEATTESFMRNLVIFSFADAGFNSLEGSRSTQAYAIIIGRASGKDNYVQGQGWISWSNATKIVRVARSSLACESVAISNTVDHTSWYQMYVRELITGCFYRDAIEAKDNLPLLNPFLFGNERTNL